MIQQDKARITIIVVLSVLVLMIIAFAWSFTSQTGQQSNNESFKLVDYIENIMAKNFEIDRSDLFWRETLNVILRKAAHFIEYMLLGIVLCALLNVALIKYGPAVSISLIACLILAILDEFRQNFIAGRNPRWEDVRIDVCGAVLGVALVTVIAAFLYKFKSLKSRIKVLEKEREM